MNSGNHRKILLQEGRIDGSTFAGELEGGILYCQTRTPCVDMNVNPCLPDGSWNPDFFTGFHWVFEKYQQTGRTAVVDGVNHEVFEYVETTERFDAVER